MKISFVGCGKVGAAAAYTASFMGLADEIVMVDAFCDKAEGEALDILQCQAFFPQVAISSGTMECTAGSDIVVISAGIPRKADEARVLLLSRNASLIADLVKQAVVASPGCILLIVTNPLDVMTQLAYQVSGLPASRVIGMGTVLDTFRYRSYLASAFGCDGRDIDAYVIGEHGETMVPLTGNISVKGVPLTSFASYSEEKVQRICQEVIAASGQVIALKGGTVFAPAASACAILEAIVKNQRRVLPVCTFQPDLTVAVSLPSIVGREGVSAVLPVPLTEEEKQGFKKSVDNIASFVKEMQLHI